jgi:transcriptional regulator with XRE-family HTH domain
MAPTVKGSEHDGDSQLRERFAANLQRIRKEPNLSQEDLANRAEIHRTQVSLIEGGKRTPRLDTLVKLAGALETTANELLQGISFTPLQGIKGKWDID